MSDNLVPESKAKEMEVSVIRAFATAIIEFEPVLYQKFLLQTKGLITEEMFKETLTNMKEKGYVVPLEFHGRQCWRRLATEDDIIAEYYSPDEVREIIKEGQALAPKRRIPEKEASLVTQARNTAQEVLDLVKTKMSESERIEKLNREELRRFFETLRHALADSEKSFLNYLQRNMPNLHDSMKEILDRKGVDILLPALRIIESGLLEPNKNNY